MDFLFVMKIVKDHNAGLDVCNFSRGAYSTVGRLSRLNVTGKVEFRIEVWLLIRSYM